MYGNHTFFENTMFDMKNFNIEQMKKISTLLLLNKKEYLVDLHVHTCYSADGFSTVQQVIDRAVEKGFDIISITDHDSINAYHELIRDDSVRIPNSIVVIP